MRPLLALLLLAASLAWPAAAPAAQGWTWPLRGEVITHYRNGADPYAGGQHRGIDVAGRVGAPVVAAAGGTVRFAGTVGSSGRAVTVRTADGRLDTSYLHLSSMVVRAGQVVAAGDRVGAVGVSGRRSAQAPHLHFGVRDAGTRHGYRDPLAFLPAPGGTPRSAPPPGAVPVGVPARPAPTPVRGPVRSPAHRHVPSPRRAPAPRRTPLPAGAPRRVPHGAPGPLAAPSPALARRPADLRGPTGDPVAGRHASPAGAPSLGPAPAAVPRGAGAHAPARSAAATGEPGLDIGWALACLGLLGAGALAVRRGGSRVASARRAVLRDHPHLLRERRAASRARLHDDRRRRARAQQAPAR